MAGGGGRGLSSLVLFAECTDDELRSIATMSHRRVVDTGMVVIEEGDHHDALSFVLSGSVEVRRGKVVAGRLGAGDLVGELSLLDGEPATAQVVVAELTELVTIESHHLPALLAMPSVGPKLRAIASARLQATPDRLVTAASVPVVRTPPRVRGVGAGLQAGSRAHPARTAALSLLAIVVAGTATFFVTQRNKSTEVAIGDLLAQLSSDPQVPGPSVSTPSAATPSATSPPTASAAPSNEPATPTDRPAAPASSTSPDAPSTAPTAPPSPTTRPSPTATTKTLLFTTPAPGVYTYDTSGSEKISIAGAKHTYPEETYAVVQHTGGCGWRSEHHVLEEHLDRRDFCSDAQQVAIKAFLTEVEFFGQRDGLTYICEPPARILWDTPAGTREEGTCASADGKDKAAYVGVGVGPETLTIGGQGVPTTHISVTFTMSGSARGTSRVEQWLDPGTGLIVRMERTVDTLADGPWGDVRYQEDATFQLASMTPRN